MELQLTNEVLEEMRDAAREAFPRECCGFVVDRNGVLEVVRVTNIQDECHARDPVQFPRTAETAYTMGEESAPVLLAADRGEIRLHAFYHSHPQHDAYFSAEDRKQANGPWDEPMYPAAGQVVISVYDAEVAAMAAFRWNSKLADFVEVPLSIRD